MKENFEISQAGMEKNRVLSMGSGERAKEGMDHMIEANKQRLSELVNKRNTNEGLTGLEIAELVALKKRFPNN